MSLAVCHPSAEEWLPEVRKVPAAETLEEPEKIQRVWLVLSWPGIDIKDQLGLALLQRTQRKCRDDQRHEKRLQPACRLHIVTITFS